MPNPAELVLIDGHALVYRAYFALPTDMATSSGELTNAVFGFASMLLNVLRDEQPEYLAVTFDRGLTGRDVAYTEYKANRASMPSDLHIQMERIRELLQVMHIPTYEVEGFEADDVLAALAAQATERELDVLIVTGDTDTFQLIGPRVRVMMPRRSFGDTIVYDVTRIRERYGLEPRQLIDYKGLIGDTGDNVPGVRGVGDKTATKLIQEYGSLEAVYENLEKIASSRFRKALEEGRDIAFLSKQLVTITTDVPVTLNLEECRVKPLDREAVVELFRQLEFRSLVDRLPGGAPEPGDATQLSFFFEKERAAGAAETAEGYEVVDSQEALDAMVSDLQQAEAVVVDVESTSVDPMNARLVGIALAATEGRAYYVPVGHQGEHAGTNLPLPLVVDRLKPLFQDPNVVKIAHNANYDLTVLAEHGLEVGALGCDTMIAEWLLNPGSHSLGLKTLAWSRLGIEMTPIEDLIGTGRKQLTMDLVPVDRVVPYACADADMTLRLARLLQDELHEKALWPLFAEVEMRLVPVV
ncbi:MAG TPA: 5'-3' exonuclease H3TH domain-containing protein, partial [Anaerolineae bacterium]|nr:5'-3' exonuclease H3TH domain-containing protein [Anaerolineae bacterium]